MLEPLGPYLARASSSREADFYPEAIDPFRWQGELMCIPQNLSSLVVYYNKELFDDAGLPYPEDDWTWDEFLATAQALTQDIDGDGATDQYGLGTEASIFRVAPFIWQNGGELVVTERTARPSASRSTHRPAREAIQWFVDLQVAHHVVPDAEAEAAEDSESRFLNGTTAMFLNSRRGVPTYREITGFDWDVAALPAQGAAGGHPPLRRLLHGRRRGRARTPLGVHRVRQLARGPGDHRPLGPDRAVAGRGRQSEAFLDPEREAGQQPGLPGTIPLHPGGAGHARLGRRRGAVRRGARARLLRRRHRRRGDRRRDHPTTPFFAGEEG